MAMPLESWNFVYLPEQSVSLFDIYEMYVTVLNSLVTENYEVAKVTIRLP